MTGTKIAIYSLSYWGGESEGFPLGSLDFLSFDLIKILIILQMLFSKMLNIIFKSLMSSDIHPKVDI